MRKAQSTLEYAVIVGFIAAALSALIFYVGRSHQGNMRSQANQLSQDQYAPGKTTINNNETKNLKSQVAASSTTTTIHDKDHPVGEKNTYLEGLLIQVGEAYGSFYDVLNDWEIAVAGEGTGQALRVRNGLWPWDWDTSCRACQTHIIMTALLPDRLDRLNELQDLAAAAAKNWPDRKPDKSYSGSSTKEDGTLESTKTINESLGAL